VGEKTVQLPWAPRSPGRRCHGTHPGVAALLFVKRKGGGAEEKREAPAKSNRNPQCWRCRHPYIPCAAPRRCAVLRLGGAHRHGAAVLRCTGGKHRCHCVFVLAKSCCCRPLSS
jgi:hypothetical protein